MKGNWKMIKINYISWLSTKLQRNRDEFTLPEDIKTVSMLIDWLQQKGDAYRAVFSHKNVIYASLNGSVIDHETLLQRDDEITFFAPIAGG